MPGESEGPEEEGVGLELEALSSGRAIFHVALPAVLLNAAPPLTAAVQTALLGNLASTSALAAYVGVSTCVGFLGRICNFLVDGVSAKVGAAAGACDWAALATHARLSLRWSAVLGVGAVPLLLAARWPGLAMLGGEVAAAGGTYWTLRAFTTPLQLLNMAAAGILQGYSRVRVNAALTSGAAVLEMAASAAVLRWRADGTAASASLVALGLVSMACQLLLAAASLACMLLLPPPEARGQLRLLGMLRSSGGSRAAGHDELAPAAPLLGDSGGEDGPDSTASEAGPHPRRGERQALEQAAEEAHAAPAQLFDQATLEFLRDGADMFVRSMTLQLTFLLALAAAARLGTAVLAAHSIVGQLWVIVSYAVDGFAAAGIVLGSRLAGRAGSASWRATAQHHMRRLTCRILWAGTLMGLAAGVAFLAARDATIRLFTSDAAVGAALRGGPWLVLALAQPLNGCLFVADGLQYATQRFRFVRNAMVLGFAAVFCPLLALEVWAAPGLALIWSAKAALNVWRLAAALYLIFVLYLPHFGDSPGSGGSGGSGGDAGEHAA